MVLLAAFGGAASAWAFDETTAADWVEQAVPTPPAYPSQPPLPLEMPPYVSVRAGIDAASLSLGADGVVRYVVVLRNASGSESAWFEGLRCATLEVKTYARADAGKPWSVVASPSWRSIKGGGQPHALMFARQAACDDTGMVRDSAAAIVRALRR
ncbi:MAG: hypothetical protein Fur007_14290 [Rhodoferax sp.]